MRMSVSELVRYVALKGGARLVVMTQPLAIMVGLA